MGPGLRYYDSHAQFSPTFFLTVIVRPFRGEIQYISKNALSKDRQGADVILYKKYIAIRATDVLCSIPVFAKNAKILSKIASVMR